MAGLPRRHLNESVEAVCQCVDVVVSAWASPGAQPITTRTKHREALVSLFRRQKAGTEGCEETKVDDILDDYTGREVQLWKDYRQSLRPRLPACDSSVIVVGTICVSRSGCLCGEQSRHTS